MESKKQIIPLTDEQRSLINNYYKKYGKPHLISCINKVTKGQVKGEILNDYIGIAEEAVCKSAKNYMYGKGMAFSTWVEKNVRSSICTQLRDSQRQKRKPQSVTSLDSIGENISVEEKREDNTYETVVNYMKQLSEDEKIMVYLRCQGADLDDISDAFHVPVSLIKESFKKMGSYEKTRVLFKRRRIEQ